MSVHQSGKKWDVRWREGTKNRSRRFDRKADAVRFDAEVRRASQLGSIIPARTGGETLEEFIDGWLAIKEHELAPATLKSYTLLLDIHVAPDLGHIPVSQLRPAILEEWFQRRLSDGVGKVSLGRTLVALRQVLDRAVRLELLPFNPTSGLEAPKQGKRIPVPATPEQIEALRDDLLSNERMWEATLVSVLAYAGLRPGEALALRWSDIGKEAITVSRAASFGQEKGTKTGGVRVVRPPRQVIADLKEWKLASPLPFELVFPRRDGEIWNTYDWRNWRRRVCKPAALRAGFPENFRPYDLRHARASMLAAEGRPITEAAYEMGHSPQMFLSTYAHLIEQARGRVVRAEDWIAEARSRGQEEAQAH